MVRNGAGASESRGRSECTAHGVFSGGVAGSDLNFESITLASRELKDAGGSTSDASGCGVSLRPQVS